MTAVIWTKDVCPFCIRAKKLLTKNNITYEERVVGEKWSKQDLLKLLPEAKTVPQIFIDNVHIGGYTELVEHLSSL